MSKRAPPSGAAPLSQEAVAIVKKKLAAPKGPPPAGLAGFKPKALPPTERSSQSNSYVDEERERERDYDRDRERERDRDREYDRDRSDSRDRDDIQYRYDDDGPRSDSDRGSHYGNSDNEESRDDSDASPEPKYKGAAGGSSSAAQAKAISHSRGDKEDADEPGSIFSSAMQTAKASSKDDEKAKAKAVNVSQPTQLVPGSMLPQCIDRSKKPTIFNFTPILKVTYRELRDFVLSPAQPGVVVRCYIERDRTGMNMFSPVYSLCADLEDGTGRELLACRKVLQSRSSHYVFSLKSEDLWRKREQRSRLYLGKLRSNGPNEHVLYDNGTMSFPEGMKDREEEEDAKKSDATAGESLYRKELAVIWLNTKTRPAPSGVRGTEICIPGTFLSPEQVASAQGAAGGDKDKGKTVVTKVGPGGAVQEKGQHSSRDLVNPFSKIRSSGKQNSTTPRTCFVLHERTSRYDPLSSCLVDFKGRANMASVKNCQFVESGPQDGSGGLQSTRPDDEKDYILQLGKTTDDCFNCDFTYPLSLLQAFAICVARFDAKLSW